MPHPFPTRRSSDLSANTRMTDRSVGRDPDSSQSAEGTARDPRAIAPIAVWLASDEGGVANGRVFGATGYKITLFKEPTLERVLWNHDRSEEHTSELQSLMRISYAVFGLKKK